MTNIHKRLPMHCNLESRLDVRQFVRSLAGCRVQTSVLPVQLAMLEDPSFQ